MWLVVVDMLDALLHFSGEKDRERAEERLLVKHSFSITSYQFMLLIRAYFRTQEKKGKNYVLRTLTFLSWAVSFFLFFLFFVFRFTSTFIICCVVLFFVLSLVCWLFVVDFSLLLLAVSITTSAWWCVVDLFSLSPIQRRSSAYNTATFFLSCIICQCGSCYRVNNRCTNKIWPWWRFLDDIVEIYIHTYLICQYNISGQI